MEHGGRLYATGRQGGYWATMAKIDKILVATDGSFESLEAARYTATLVEGLKPAISVIHVIPSPTIPAGSTPIRPEEEVTIEKTFWDGAQAILDRAMQPFREAGVPVEGVIASGDAAPEIIDLARRERFDLIVVASRGKGGAERAILGSTSEAVVAGAPCPVLVVRRGTRAR